MLVLKLIMVSKMSLVKREWNVMDHEWYQKVYRLLLLLAEVIMDTLLEKWSILIFAQEPNVEC